MAIIDLGKVKGDKGISVRNRGDWNKTAQYLNDAVYTDVVSHMGSLWTCLVTNTNIEPGKGKPQWNLSAEGVASVENNLTTTKVGSALDATQGKALKGITDKIYADKLVTMNEINLVTEKGFFVDALAVKELNSNLNSKFIWSKDYACINTGNTQLASNSYMTVALNEALQILSFYTYISYKSGFYMGSGDIVAKIPQEVLAKLHFTTTRQFNGGLSAYSSTGGQASVGFFNLELSTNGDLKIGTFAVSGNIAPTSAIGSTFIPYKGWK